MRRRPAPWQAASGSRVLVGAAALAALLLAAPILTVLVSVFQTGQGTMAHLFATVLPEYILNTVQLALLVAIGTFLIGTGTAWLVTVCTFPGRRIAEWALILPLAAPAYVVAYAYTDFLQHPGLVQTWLRAVTGWGPRDYWFPNIRSLPGAALVFTFVLYPYVYLLARTAFLSQSVRAFEVSRTLGRSALEAFLRVALPMARPAIATGVALALMETLADFGTVAHFSVPTFTTGIYRTWFSMGDQVAASQLAAGLLAFVALVLALERLQRRRARFAERNFQDLPEFRLRGWRAAAASLFCLLPIVAGFLLPVAILVRLHLAGGHSFLDPRYITLAGNSFTLALAGALATIAIGLLLVYAARLAPNGVTRAINQVAALGYAVPGSVIAVGLLVPLTTFDNGFDAFMRATFGISTGLLLTGSIAALVFAYCVRFMAVCLNTLAASLGKISLSLDAASRTLGARPGEMLWRIHLPLLRGGLLAAGLIVFVDIVKELPATLIMRPFNFDTLAIQAYRLASDERLAQAATPSLVIVAVSLLPVILLSRQIRGSRPGRRPGS